MAYVDEVLSDSPAGYWPFDEASGFPADDAGSNDVDNGAGTPIYQVAGPITSGSPNYAIDFDGSTEYFSCGDDPALDLGDVFTLEAWIKRASSGTNDHIINKDTGAYCLVIESDRLMIAKSNVALIAQSTVTITDTDWHHVACTKDGGTSAKLYLDGDDVTGTVTNALCENNIANLFFASSAGTQHFFHGSLAHLAIYGSSLPQSRIQAHYAAATQTAAVRAYKRLYGPAQLTDTAADLYTCPASTVARTLHIHASNPSGSPVDVNLSIGTDAAGTRVWDDLEIPADSVEDVFDPYELAAGEKIQGWASTAGTVVVTITGHEDPV